MAWRLSRDCLILPESGVDPGILDRLAGIGVAGEIKWGAYSSTKALAEYRQGRYASAVDWAEKTLAHETRSGCLAVQTSAILAMARHRLHQSEQARAALTGAQDDADKTLPKLDSGDLGSNWRDVITSRALLREATGLIQGTPETNAETK